MNRHRSYVMLNLCTSLWLSVVMLLCVCPLAVASVAGEESSGESGMGAIIEKWVNIAHQKISNRILRTSERFDTFFGDERVKEEQEATQLVVIPTLTFSEGEQVEFTCPLTFNVALPHLKKRWHLMVETILTEEDTGNDEGTEDDVKGNDVSVSLRYKILQQARPWLSFDTGVKFEPDNIIKPFERLRFRHVFDLEPWALRLIQVILWIEDEGWGESSQFDIDRKLRQNLLFRISNQARWSENSEGLEFSQTYSLRWQLSGRRALGLELFAKGQTRPSLTMDEYRVSAIFRRRLYKNWIFSEIESGIQMLREDDFGAAPFVMVNLEWIFGEYSAK